MICRFPQMWPQQTNCIFSKSVGWSPICADDRSQCTPALCIARSLQRLGALEPCGHSCSVTSSGMEDFLSSSSSSSSSNMVLHSIDCVGSLASLLYDESSTRCEIFPT